LGGSGTARSRSRAGSSASRAERRNTRIAATEAWPDSSVNTWRAPAYSRLQTSGEDGEPAGGCVGGARLSPQSRNRQGPADHGIAGPSNLERRLDSAAVANLIVAGVGAVGADVHVEVALGVAADIDIDARDVRGQVEPFLVDFDPGTGR